ncbi:hard-surface inducible [Fusarium albosuccineum]|uniref:Hard-surface inducible n=1 Tax=Fusarium albosuccineum TaxID=1237068 RepID=A0A8H4L582_9HYPO|nr:hard-surface inducible [Fusarium albosuccineum]
MFVYEGRLDWKPYGDNETFVIILPNGPVRLGDTVYLFFQWTKDAKGVQKPNWFQKYIVDSLSKTKSGDDTFVLKHSYYTWEITTEQVYGKLSVVMSNPQNYKSSMSFERIWQSQGEQSTGATRIWTGKINWSVYAKDEMAIFIVPEGFGDGKPVLSLWQWTKDGSGKDKAPSFRHEVQKLESGATNGVKFSYHSYYDITCNWDEKTEKLAVHMKGPEANSDLGEFTLSALIDRHSHDWNPPETSTSKAELEVRLPQPQPSLPRILTPMPFPKTLIDTLAHTISFADQAAYLAKYAQDRFTALDTDFHARGEQLDTAKAEIGELKKQVTKVIDDLNVEKAKATDLEKRLAEAQAAAAAKEAELNKQIQDNLKQNQDHDKKDHDTISGLEKMLADERVAKAELQRVLDETRTALTAAETRLKAETANVIRLTAELAAVEAQLQVEKKKNEKLQAESDAKTKQIDDLTKERDDFQEDLKQAQEATKAQKDLVSSKSKLIETLTKKVREHEDEVSAATIAFDNLQTKYTDEVQDLKEQLRKAQRAASDPSLRFRCNLRSEASGSKDVFFDLNGGGGKNPPVHAISDNSYKTNPNQSWEFYSVGTSNTRVIIKNTGSKAVLFSVGHGNNVRCEKDHNTSDAAAQWELVDATTESINENVVVGIRNVKDNTYLDLSGSNTNNGTAFLTYNGHGGKNQRFKLWRRW